MDDHNSEILRNISMEIRENMSSALVKVFETLDLKLAGGHYHCRHMCLILV